MTAYRRNDTTQLSATDAVAAAKAKRQARLRKVRSQRARGYKRTVADWMKDGLLMPASELKAKR